MRQGQARGEREASKRVERGAVEEGEVQILSEGRYRSKGERGERGAMRREKREGERETVIRFRGGGEIRGGHEEREGFVQQALGKG